jgi:hypothetical protein
MVKMKLWPYIPQLYLKGHLETMCCWEWAISSTFKSKLPIYAISSHLSLGPMKLFVHLCWHEWSTFWALFNSCVKKSNTTYGSRLRDSLHALLPGNIMLTSHYLNELTEHPADLYPSFLTHFTRWNFCKHILITQLPLWSSGQSSWLQIQRSGFDFRRYQIIWQLVDLEWGPLSLVSTTEELLERKSSGSGLENLNYGCRGSAVLIMQHPPIH